MMLESFGAIGTGWVYRAFVEPRMTFPVWVGGWPQPLGGYGMYAWFVMMGTAAIGAMVGWRYRLTGTLLAIMWTFAYLTQKTHYNNHYYLAVLICWAMVLLPAHRRAAVDVARTGIRHTQCPAWIPLAFKVQVLIVFTYAAIAKLYPGWVSGEYIAHVFGHKTHRAIIGPLLGESWFQMAISYGGIAFDALVIPALWWSRTRILAFTGLIVFNLFNSYVFLIGVFPYMVLALSVFFFDSKTIERRFAWLPGLGRASDSADGALAPAASADERATSSPPALRAPAGPGDIRAPVERRSPRPTPRWILALVVSYFVLQVALPLRHHLFPGDVTWTEEGHRMSWRMMLRAKAGRVRLLVKDRDSGRSWTVDQREWLTRKQRNRIATKPDMLYWFVQVLKAHYAEQGMPNIAIYAQNSRVSLNGRPPLPLFDASVDLATADYPLFGRSTWVLDRPLGAASP